MAPFAIVKHLDVVEQIGPGFVPGSITNAIDALAFEQAEEALDDGIEAPISVKQSRAPFLANKDVDIFHARCSVSGIE